TGPPSSNAPASGGRRRLDPQRKLHIWADRRAPIGAGAIDERALGRVAQVERDSLVIAHRPLRRRRFEVDDAVVCTVADQQLGGQIGGRTVAVDGPTAAEASATSHLESLSGD